MEISNGFRTGRHVVFLMHAHLVFVTKYRHPCSPNTHLRRIEEIMCGVYAQFETEPEGFNGETNHVHLLVIFPPKITVSKLINSLKGVSSRLLRGAPVHRAAGPSCDVTAGRRVVALPPRPEDGASALRSPR
ncbi:IS200/IS605 family transposase [Saccharopolyspora sp. NPDC002686]|uniref:IS200/IS605 family transposase n=1 Tax=Saccharopolyspora sp. NPDC002686 TaxID=3154541 RepID=UPI00331DDFF6